MAGSVFARDENAYSCMQKKNQDFFTQPSGTERLCERLKKTMVLKLTSVTVQHKSDSPIILHCSAALGHVDAGMSRVHVDCCVPQSQGGAPLAATCSPTPLK